jgi:hypothetical protein
MKITLSKIRNLELFLLQIQEGRNKMLIREGKYSDLTQTDSELDNLIYRNMGYAKLHKTHYHVKKQKINDILTRLTQRAYNTHTI